MRNFYLKSVTAKKKKKSVFIWEFTKMTRFHLLMVVNVLMGVKNIPCIFKSHGLTSAFLE